jgi:hypothetical protein
MLLNYNQVEARILDYFQTMFAIALHKSLMIYFAYMNKKPLNTRYYAFWIQA